MIGVLIFPGFQLLDAAGPIAVFETAGQISGITQPIRCFATRGGTVDSSSGIELTARRFVRSATMKTLIVAGGDGVFDAAKCPATLNFVRSCVNNGVRVASVCTGTYVLAAAGVLDGRRATTHWLRAPHFASCYPKVRLEPDRIFVRDDNVWSSAGISAGIDLALAMVTEDLGQEIARRAARRLIVYHQRMGGQSQFSSLLELNHPDGRFGSLLAWVRENLHKRLTIDSLAEKAGISVRHFARAFSRETGVTPAKALERLRLEVARQRVQSGAESIERVAELTGFHNAERMRRAFIRTFGQPPQALRRMARTDISAESPTMVPNVEGSLEETAAGKEVLYSQMRRHLMFAGEP